MSCLEGAAPQRPPRTPSPIATASSARWSGACHDQVVRALCLLLVLVAAPAEAQMHEVTLDLGDNIAASRLCPTGATASRSCWGWTPIGFSFGERSELLTAARTFARSPTSGAILAVFGRLLRATRIGSYAASAGQPRVLRTVDGGVTWSEVPWDWDAAPIAFAFDNTSDEGVAIGELGHVWSTRDAGEHWTDHGGSTSSRWVAAAIARGEVVLLDSAGGVFRSHDGGFRRDRVVTEPTASLEQRDDEVIVHTATRSYVVARGESVRREP